MVASFGNHRGDPAASQFGADRPIRVRLIAAHPLRVCPGWPAAVTVHAQMRQQMLEDWAVVGLTGGDQHHQGTARAVDEMVDLAGQSATRAANAVVRRLDVQILVIRPSPLCGG